MDYQTIDGEFQAKYEILHSVFICNIKGINSFDEGLNFYQNISHKYNDASHNCYAIVTNKNEQKFSDDGEPQGTAGLPILQVLKKRNITNAIAVVTRYFGGIKLGAGGLLSAYTQSAVDGINASKIVTKMQSAIGVITLDYTEFSAVNNYIQNSNFIILNTVYNDMVELKFALPINEKKKAEDRISQITLGKKQIEWQYEDYLVY